MFQTLWYQCTVAQRTKSLVNRWFSQPEKVIKQVSYIILSSCQYELNTDLQIVIELCTVQGQQAELIKLIFRALHLVEELFPRRTWLNCKLQLGIHGGDTDI